MEELIVLKQPIIFLLSYWFLDLTFSSVDLL